MRTLIWSLVMTLVSAPAYGQQTVGVFLNTTEAFDGYTLFSPASRTETYLIDNCGHVINQWYSAYRPGQAAYLLQDGSLLRTGRISSLFNAGGTGGRLERFSWDGELEWAYEYSSETYHQHHDIEPLPNGNVLVLAWEQISRDEAIAAGRDPATVSINGLWPEHIVELEPAGADSAIIVWSWHLKDHLVQDFDTSKANYGIIAEHSDRIDLNFISQGPGADWIHANSVDYFPERDQIVISSRVFSEIWVIDHSTTTEEAASDAGGLSGKGGRILYRWGNPQTYQRGGEEDQRLFGQHDARWLEDGTIMVFNNGFMRPGPDFSQVDVITPPWDPETWAYQEPAAGAYLPDTATWTYAGEPGAEFFSSNISGSMRLPNGNTMICIGSSGRFIEVDSTGDLVWEYINPVGINGPVDQGSNPPSNQCFRAERYGPDDPAFAGRTLDPGPVLELNPLPDTCVIYPEDSMSTSVTRAVPASLHLAGNPVDRELVLLNHDQLELEITVTDLSGRVVLSMREAASTIRVPAGNWPAGLYILLATDAAARQQAVFKVFKL
ncbi:MAG: aryl-sulfate sulfotransferase [Saprospiraceae bacterium]|nr:aryl-sulfate sulfotransferase [Saprospiraceae bacterium]